MARIHARDEERADSRPAREDLRPLLVVSRSLESVPALAARVRGLFDVIPAAGAPDARRQLRRRPIAAILLDAALLDERREDWDWLGFLRRERSSLPVLLLETRRDREALERALRRGAEGCLGPNPSRQELLAAVEMASALRAARAQAGAHGRRPAQRPATSAPGAGAGGDPPGDLVRLPYNDAKREALRRFQLAYTGALLREAGGKVSEAARLAGIPRQTLHRILRALNGRG